MDNGLSLTVAESEFWKGVLILIVMDNGLSHSAMLPIDCQSLVLILIVMDNGLSPGELKLLSVEVAEVLILIVMDNGLSRISWLAESLRTQS